MLKNDGVLAWAPMCRGVDEGYLLVASSSEACCTSSTCHHDVWSHDPSASPAIMSILGKVYMARV